MAALLLEEWAEIADATRYGMLMKAASDARLECDLARLIFEKHQLVHSKAN
jgi:hypothetical protein